MAVMGPCRETLPGNGERQRDDCDGQAGNGIGTELAEPIAFPDQGEEFGSPALLPARNRQAVAFSVGRPVTIRVQRRFSSSATVKACPVPLACSVSPVITTVAPGCRIASTERRNSSGT